MHGELEKSQIGSDVAINPHSSAATPRRTAEITLMVVLAKTGRPDPR